MAMAMQRITATMAPAMIPTDIPWPCSIVLLETVKGDKPSSFTNWDGLISLYMDNFTGLTIHGNVTEASLAKKLFSILILLLNNANDSIMRGSHVPNIT